MQQDIDGAKRESSGRRRRRRKSIEPSISARMRGRRYKKIFYTALFVVASVMITVWVAIRLGGPN
jgi:hypothetical protein